MTVSKTLWLFGIIVVITVGYFAWKLTARSAYESAPYTVLQIDGRFELREYPELMLATTNMQFDYQGNDGSFMRLFNYICGKNASDQKIAMTIPVFMEQDSEAKRGTMSFVLPKQFSENDAPSPSNSDVQIKSRNPGRFATIRFSGRLNPERIAQQTSQLKSWINKQGLSINGPIEVAGYDAPWTPGPFRRNEILIPVISVK